MNFLELTRQVDEAVQTKQLEDILKFVKTLKTSKTDVIKKEIKKKYKKLNDKDIDLVIQIM